MATTGKAVRKKSTAKKAKAKATKVEVKLSRALAPSPLGPLLLEATDEGLVSLRLPSEESPHPPAGPPPRGAAARHLAAARRQLAEYFSGRRRRFDVPLAPGGGDFERNVWDQTTRIPYGTTISYNEMAERLGEPKRGPVVGKANRTNPIPIVIPCHRIVQNDGSLGPYSGGSPEIKWRLLQLEGIAPVEA